MLSRQTLRVASHVARIEPQLVRLASNSSRPTARKTPLETQSRIDSTFFRPSLSRSSSYRKAEQSARRQRQATGGLNDSHWLIIGAALALYYADFHSGTSRSALDSYFGRDSKAGMIHMEAASGPNLNSDQLPKGDLQVVIDPDTQQAFPLYLTTPPTSLPSSSGQLKLVGLGVRTVSFLRVKVYVAGLYMEESKLNAVLAQGGLQADQSLEQLVKTLLDEGTPAVVRIVPVRNTDFNHLRDGFIRALQGRLKKAVKEGRVQSSSVTERSFEESIQQIKESFPRGSVPKGSPLDMVIAPSASTGPNVSLSFEYDGQVFGQLKTATTTSAVSSANNPDANFSAARELVLAYFADKGEISAAFKKSVQSGFSRE